MLKPVLLTQVSFAGMRDSLDPSTAEPRKARLLQNCYPSDTFEGAATVGRPGFQQAGGVIGGGSRVQGIAQYTKLDGTETTVAVANGLLYTFNWTTRVWTNVPLSGGAQLATSGPVDLVNFANKLIVSDGLHQPFMWDLTTFTVLANAPVFYGPPTVYYDLLFGIKATDHTTFDWSQPNDPTTGYEAGGFNNAWTLGQTKQDALRRLVGTNSALYYWRERSTGYIAGDPLNGFVSTGTREGVSDTVGTVSPRAVVAYENALYFLSADGQPYGITIGGGLKPLWTDLRETLATIPRGSLPSALGVGDPLTQMVLLGLVQQSQGEVSLLVAIDSRTSLIGGVWSGFQPTALGLVKDDNLVPRIMHGTVNGFVYDHGDPNGVLWQDTNSLADGDAQAISHTVIGTPLGYDLKYEKLFDRIDLSLRLQTNLTDVTVTYETPRGLQATTSQGLAPLCSSTAPTVDSTTPLVDTSGLFQFAGISALWDVAVWDVDTWSLDKLEQHFAIGWAGRGRWIAPQIRHSYGNERFGLEGWTVTALPETTDPGVP